MVHLVADAAGLRAGAVLWASTLQVGAHVEETARYKNNSFFFLYIAFSFLRVSSRALVGSEDESAHRTMTRRSMQLLKGQYSGESERHSTSRLLLRD